MEKRRLCLEAMTAWGSSKLANHVVFNSGKRAVLINAMASLIPFLLTISHMSFLLRIPGAQGYGAGGDDRWEMVQRKGNAFMVNDKPFYVNGFNTYWLMILAVDPSTRGKVSEVLRQAFSAGLTVCRTWAFNDGGWRALQKSPGVYDEQVFTALDFVVSEARKNKIRLILPLCNNWEDYGGKARYVRWGREAGLNLTSDDDFFSDPTVKRYYRSHVQAVLSRVNTVTNTSYREDPTIFAWELMNEPRCPSDPSGDKLQSWIQEMAAYVKSIDPVHLLGTGSEGFYGPSSPERQRLQNPNHFAGESGTDFLRNHKAFGVDFASAHLYPDSWLPKTTSPKGRLQFTRAWMKSHIEDAERLSMPVIFGEFGFSSKEDEDQFDQPFRNAFIELVYETILNSTRRGGAGGGSLLWQLFPEGVDYMDDGYAVVLGDLPHTTSLLSRHSRRLQIFNSRCSWNCRWSCRKREEDDDGESSILLASNSR